MKILKTTAFSAACAFLACASFAQQPAANAAQAAKAAPAQSAEQPAPATMNVASNEDRSYLADYDGKSATVTLFDEKAKRENVATFKSATDSAVVFVGGGGDYSVSKKKSVFAKSCGKTRRQLVQNPHGFGARKLGRGNRIYAPLRIPSYTFNVDNGRKFQRLRLS